MLLDIIGWSTITEWYAAWREYRYFNEINFIIFIPLFFLLRSMLLRKLKGFLDSSIGENGEN